MRWVYFREAEIQAMLAGQKSQFRQVVRRTSTDWDLLSSGPCTTLRRTRVGARVRKDVMTGWYANFDARSIPGTGWPTIPSPFNLREILFVKESWKEEQGQKVYRTGADRDSTGWRKYLDMTAGDARLYLRICRIDLQRLQTISEQDAEKEGFYPGWSLNDRRTNAPTAREAFRWYWDGVLCKRYERRKNNSWKENPWVWVFQFERLSKEEALETKDDGVLRGREQEE